MQTIFGNAAYIIAIALQLAAALLLVGNTGITRKQIIKAYCARHTAIAFNEDGTLADSSALRKTVVETWTNYCAFLYLFGGYILQVFGLCTIDKLHTSFLIIFLVLILVIVTGRLAKYKGQHFGTLRVEEITPNDGVLIMHI